jgi:2-dehydropantoate 2-reductase
MRITLYGAGAIGCYLAAHLARVPGLELSMVARGETLAAIRRDGVRLQTAEGETRVPVHVTDDPSDLPAQDIVFVTLKGHQVPPAIAGIAGLLGPESAVIPPTTGIPFWYFHGRGERQVPALDPGGVQWAAFRPERCLGCTYWVACDTVGPGIVHTEGPAGLPIGEPDGSSSPRLRRLQEAMQEAGLRAPIREDIRGEIWTKMINSLVWNPAAVLTGGTLRDIAGAPDVVATVRRMMAEAEAIPVALGTALPTTSEQRIATTLAMGGHRMSMLQDFTRGRLLEYPVLHDSLVAMREIAGLETPTIDAVYALLALKAKLHGVAP